MDGLITYNELINIEENLTNIVSKNCKDNFLLNEFTTSGYDISNCRAKILDITYGLKSTKYLFEMKTEDYLKLTPNYSPRPEAFLRNINESNVEKVIQKKYDKLIDATSMYYSIMKLGYKFTNSVTFYKEKATYFKVGNVFDVSQTTMPFEEFDSSLNPILEDSRADGITDIFIKAIYKDGIKVKYEDIDSGAKGYCDFDNKTIVVKKNLSDLMRLKVIIHEYAHSLAHTHLKDNNKEYQEHREQYESEAEAIAYVVSKYLGFDTKNYSMTYLYSWSKNKDFKELDDSFETINRFSKKIIKNYEEIYDKELDLTDNNMNFVEI